MKTILERLSLPISHVFQAAEKMKPERVDCYRLCAAPNWAENVIVGSRRGHVPQCPVAGETDEVDSVVAEARSV